MFNLIRIVGSLVGLGFLIALSTSSALAQKKYDIEIPASAVEQTSQFRKIEQPLGLKIFIALSGLGLIGAELWWFMFSKTQSQKAQVKQGIQSVDIVVDGGYTPDRIEVRSGELVRLNFLRKDPSSCLEQVLLPDFNRALDLVLNQTTSVEIMPEKPGEYTFTCGMNMYRGKIIAKASE
ncbi:cupredoxin domain-containing protein [Pleurocapsa sp. PCC 7319]|uniref:cupredoxin domain-containing protein n=1 Tax=Pleurocapsa sp. PCC 7319 TaxID=118161 RepID=UPI00034A7BAB|nr:cupredoxin domain-containing protein [Pleurocapsa sp. PCC 7319]